MMMMMMINNSSLTSLEIREGNYTCRDAPAALTLRALRQRADWADWTPLRAASSRSASLLLTFSWPLSSSRKPTFLLSSHFPSCPQVPAQSSLWLVTPCLQNHTRPLISVTGHEFEHRVSKVWPSHLVPFLKMEIFILVLATRDIASWKHGELLAILNTASGSIFQAGWLMLTSGQTGKSCRGKRAGD